MILGQEAPSLRKRFDKMTYTSIVARVTLMRSRYLNCTIKQGIYPQNSNAYFEQSRSCWGPLSNVNDWTPESILLLPTHATEMHPHFPPQGSWLRGSVCVTQPANTRKIKADSVDEQTGPWLRHTKTVNLRLPEQRKITKFRRFVVKESCLPQAKVNVKLVPPLSYLYRSIPK